MNFNFDRFGQYEIPAIYLSNPDGSQLVMLGSIYDRALKLRFNAISEFSFTAPKYIDGVATDYYDLLEYRRIVSIDGVANFMITQISEENDGIVHDKKIQCQSLECELSLKKLSLFKTDGSIALYDGTPSSLMVKIMVYLPGWNLSYVDPSVSGQYRSFDITDVTIYSFLTNQVSQTYQAIFVFDTIGKNIYIYSTKSAVHNTDIFFSYQNLIEKIDIKEITEELVTALNVLGGGSLTIEQVNPLGTNTIYNFQYYKNPNWMSSGLISALTAWESLYSAKQLIYADDMSILMSYNDDILAQDAIVQTEIGKLTELQSIQTVQIQQGHIDLSEINAQISAQQKVITSASKVSADLVTRAKLLNQDMALIVDQVSFENNFTSDQLDELNHYIIGSTYTNSNFIQTDAMIYSDIQTEAQHLFDQATQVLYKISEPRYTFDVTGANFVFLPEFQAFINQLSLGAVVTIEFDDGRFAYPALLGIDYNYDNPTDFKMTFSTRLRLDDSAFQFSDLFAQSLSSGLTTTFNSEQWSSWKNYSENSVTAFINSALDVSKNAVMNAKNQTFILDANGFRGRTSGGGNNAKYGDDFNPEQFWMTNNLLVFTDDHWDSAKLAIGKIVWESGKDGNGVPIYTSGYGIAADVVLGRLIAGNTLIIENQNNTFKVTGSGVTLTNAYFDIIGSNAEIKLDPNVGISINRRSATGKYDIPEFWLNALDGSVNFSGSLVAASGQFIGDITAESGHIGGWIIQRDGLYSPNGRDYIKVNGDTQLGLMTITESQGTATFNGDIFARNLQDYVYGSQIQDINADTITAGTITGIDIYGSRIMWPGVTMYSPVPGSSDIRADNNIAMYSGNSYITITPTTVNLGGNNNTVLGNISNMGAISMFAGQLNVVDANFNQGTGVSGTFAIGSGSSAQSLTFINGILCTPITNGSSGSSGGSGSQVDVSFSFASGAEGWVSVSDPTFIYGRWTGGTLENNQPTGDGLAFYSHTWRWTPSQTYTISSTTVFSGTVNLIPKTTVPDYSAYAVVDGYVDGGSTWIPIFSILTNGSSVFGLPFSYDASFYSGKVLDHIDFKTPSSSNFSQVKQQLDSFTATNLLT